MIETVSPEVRVPYSRPLQSKTDAEGAVRLAARLAMEKASLVAQRDGAINALLEKFGPLIKDKDEALAQLHVALEEWGKKNRAEFCGQSLELGHGWLRFRRGPEKLVFYAGWDKEKTLAKILSFGLTSQWNEFVRREPELDVRKLTAAAKGEAPLMCKARLKVVGLRLDRDENFEVEAKPFLGHEPG